MIWKLFECQFGFINPVDKVGHSKEIRVPRFLEMIGNFLEVVWSSNTSKLSLCLFAVECH